MTTITRRRLVNNAELKELRHARTDIVEEVADGADRWLMKEGPFKFYVRELEVGRLSESPAGLEPSFGSTKFRLHRSENIDDQALNKFSVTERTEYKLAIPIWWPYLWLPIRMALASTDRKPRRRWWWPQEVVTQETALLIGSLATVVMMAGYMGVLIGQTLAFAAKDFGIEDNVQSNTLAATRIGVLASLAFIWIADTKGRRSLTLWFAGGAIVFTVLGAFSVNIFMLGASQTIARGLTTGLITLVTVAATEQVPAGSRAISISFMALAAGFGAALVVWTLPLAGIVNEGWRLSYLLPVLFLPLLWLISRRLPETRRYIVASKEDSPNDVNWGRFALIGAAAFLGSLFLSPASQLRNEYLTDDLGFTEAEVSGFQLLLSLPAMVAIPVAGVIADRYGRRPIGALSLLIGVICSALSYQLTGIGLWVTASVGVVCTAASIPALRGYQTELFPTRSRSRVGGMLDVLTLSGSAIGLVVVGYLTTRNIDLGSSIGTMIFGPLIVVLLIVLFFPETANKELETFNPTDPELASDESSKVGPSGFENSFEVSKVSAPN